MKGWQLKLKNKKVKKHKLGRLLVESDKELESPEPKKKDSGKDEGKNDNEKDKKGKNDKRNKKGGNC